MIHLVQSSGSEHCAKYVEQAISHSPESSCPGMTACSQRVVFEAACRIVLDGDARPVVDGVLQAPIARVAPHNAPALPRLLRHRRNPGMATQSVVVSLAHRFRCLCEQRGEDGSAHSWRGAQNRHVMLPYLSRGILLRLGEPVGQAIEHGVCFSDLLDRQPNGLQERQDMCTRGSRRRFGHGERRRPEDGKDRAGVVASHAMLLQYPRYLRPRQMGSHHWRRCELQKRKLPGCVVVASKGEKRCKIAQKLLAQSADIPTQITSVPVGHARPFAEFDDCRIGGLDQPERVRVGPECRRQNVRITPVVLGAGDAEAVSEAIELLRVDGTDGEATLEQRLDDRSMRRLDRNVDGCWHRRGLPREPVRHQSQTSATVLDNPPTENLTATVGQGHIVFGTRPINACEPSPAIARHVVLALSLSSHRRDPRLSLYWRSKARSSHWTSIATNSPGQRSEPGARGTGVSWLLPANRLGSGKATPVSAESQVALRSATLHFARPATGPPSRHRPPEVQGSPRTGAGGSPLAQRPSRPPRRRG